MSATTHAHTLSSIITSGDVSQARSYFAGWCLGRTWTASEALEIRSACARWGVDPAEFSAPSPPRALDAGSLALRAHLLLDTIGGTLTDGDFQCATMAAASHPADPTYTWRMEAIRWRRCHGVEPLDLDAVFAATVDTMGLWARRAA